MQEEAAAPADHHDQGDHHHRRHHRRDVDVLWERQGDGGDEDFAFTEAACFQRSMGRGTRKLSKLWQHK